MLSRWPIRTKLIIGIGLLLTTVVILSFSGFLGVYAYRGLAKSISLRANELPLAAELAESVSALRVTYELASSQAGATRVTYDLGASQDDLGIHTGLLYVEFKTHLETVRATFENYRRQLAANRDSEHYRYIGDRENEMRTVREFQDKLADISALEDRSVWIMTGDNSFFSFRHELAELNKLSTKLPSYLHSRMENFADEVRGQYRFWIGLTLTTSLLSTLLIVLSARLFYAWIFYPLGVLIRGSRRVAAGAFGHRIHLDSQDEMAELASAMNNMTRRFQEIRDDLDRQVKQRTKEVVRGEQLASVGFLAAGVAHEINNPLASIALCAESLEERMHDIIREDDEMPDGHHNSEVTVLRTYLRMIQDEAFRCKEITEQLLDFSRLGDVQKQNTELCELTQGVIDMVSHLGKYKEKRIEFRDRESVIAAVNSQEMKQVVLNLITNGLDSLDPGGTVTIRLRPLGQMAELVVEDNGCGMTDEIQEHLFEPFFTRKRDGQGTGLGMSITYRIIADHGGRIEAHSDGAGRGSRFTVTLPISNHGQEQEHTRTAA